MSSKILRATQKLFGSSGSTSDFGEFGSKAAGAPATTKSPATIQALSSFLTGWTSAIVAQDRPYLEDMNALFLLAFQQIAYGLQAGVPEWDAGTTYYTGSIASGVGTGILYKSLADDNLNNAVTDASKWLALSDGSLLTGLANAVSGAGRLPIANVPVDPFSALLLHVRDEKTAGTGGGTFTSGAWRTRDLQTVKTNEIAGASLAANQIVLPAGTYFFQARCPAWACDNHVARLYNITDAADIMIGSGNWENSGTGSQGWCVVQGRFTLASPKTIELQHRTDTTVATNGLGHAAGIDSKNEVYSEILIWKVED